MKTGYLNGLKKGLPIGLSYLAVSFAFGVFATNGVTPLVATIISLTNLTSLGQFAGLKLIMASASFIELTTTMLLINLRYFLMSLSISQKLKSGIPLWKKLIFSFGVTDETYAVAVMEKEELTASFMLGLITLPVVGWTLGTALGAFGAGLFPDRLLEALNLALYAMFISIIMPDCKTSKPVLIVCLISIAISCVFEYVPFVNQLMTGLKIVLTTLIAAILGALIFPIKDEKQEESTIIEEPTNIEKTVEEEGNV